jgi:aryl-alcohol dehydrogenase-like predicted oxidoreductase
MRTFRLNGRELPALVVGDEGWAELPAPALMEGLRDSGVLVDTAEIYGQGASESAIGEHLPDNPVSTKYMPWPWRSSGTVDRRVEESLQRLRRARVELLFLHFPALRRPAAVIHALAEQVRRGRAGGLGLSNHGSLQVKRSLRLLDDEGLPVAGLQTEVSLVDASALRNGLLESCQRRGAVLMGFRVLRAGALVAGRRARADERRAREAMEDASQIAGVSPVQAKLIWLMEHGVVPIVGTRSPGHLQEALAACSLSLPGAALERLDRAAGLGR